MSAVPLQRGHNGHARSMPASYARIEPHVSHACKTWDCRRSYSNQMIEGCASTSSIDRHREVIDPMGLSFDALPLPLLLKHEGRQVGEIVWLRRTPYAIFVRATVFERETILWSDILTQRANRFSVQVDSVRDAVRRDADGVVIHRQWQLQHVAIADDGINPECMFWPWEPNDDEVIR